MLLVKTWIILFNLCQSLAIIGYHFKDNRNQLRSIPENGEIKYRIPFYPKKFGSEMFYKTPFPSSLKSKELLVYNTSLHIEQCLICNFRLNLNIFQGLFCCVCWLSEIFQSISILWYSVSKLVLKLYISEDSWKW